MSPWESPFALMPKPSNCSEHARRNQESLTAASGVAKYIVMLLFATLKRINIYRIYASRRDNDGYFATG
jgi:hypothetical protein